MFGDGLKGRVAILHPLFKRRVVVRTWLHPLRCRFAQQLIEPFFAAAIVDGGLIAVGAS